MLSNAVVGRREKKKRSRREDKSEKQLREEEVDSLSDFVPDGSNSPPESFQSANRRRRQRSNKSNSSPEMEEGKGEKQSATLRGAR